jgi:putative DNA primase/helicase
MGMWMDLFFEKGISVIPLKQNEKKPSIKWKKYTEERMPKDEVLAQLKKDYSENYGVICGEVSNNLLVIDVDNAELFEKLRLGELADKTLTVKTAKGFHFFLFIRSEQIKALNAFVGDKGVKTLYYPPKEIAKDNAKEEIRFQWEDHYVVGPGSTHPSGIKYEHFSNSPKDIATTKGIGILEEIERRWLSYRKLIFETKETLKEPLLDFIKRYVTPVNLEDHGDYIQMKCPFHQGTSPNAFTIYKEDNHWYDFSEEIGGRHIEFYMRFKGASRDQAYKDLKIKRGNGNVFDDTGKLLMDNLLLEVNNGSKYITVDDTEEILLYKDGIYSPAEVQIKSLVEDLLQARTTTHIVSEVVDHIKRRTYIPRDMVNKNKKLIPLMNGIFNLETGELEPYSEEKIFTYKLPVRYNPEAKCPAIEKFLSEIVYERDIQLIYELAGYCLYPEYNIQNWFMFHGPGAAGKSTLIKLLAAFLGEENISAVSLQKLNNRFAAADLFGKLANMVADLSDDDLHRTDALKALTGGDYIMAEMKFKPSFKFVNRAKLVYSCNKIPMTTDKTNAFYRRVIYVPFPNTFTPEKADKNLLSKIITEDELSGFFNKAIEALRDLLGRGYFTSTKNIEEIEELYEKASNPVYAFVQDMLDIKFDGYVSKAGLYNEFCEYCSEKGFAPLSNRKMLEQLKAYAPLEEARIGAPGNRRMVWRGVCFKENVVGVDGNVIDVTHVTPPDIPKEQFGRKPKQNTLIIEKMGDKGDKLKSGDDGDSDGDSAEGSSEEKIEGYDDDYSCYKSFFPSEDELDDSDYSKEKEDELNRKIDELTRGDF